MQIIFDSRHDSVDEAECLRDMMDAYLRCQQKEPAHTATGVGVPHKGHEAPAVETKVYPDGTAATGLAPLPPESPAVLDPVFVKDAPVSFTPGDLGAPSPADAAQSPTAPEVPQDGVPMPPTVASVPAPPGTVPEVPAAPTTSAATGELDVKGLPWDERIHAGTKAKNADGSWRQRRGLNDPALVARVEAELRNTPQATAEHAADKQEPAGWTTPAAAVPPPPVTTPPAPAAPDALTYDGFLSWVTPKMMDGSTPFDKVAAALSASGVSSLQELRDNPAAIPAVYAALGGV